MTADHNSHNSHNRHATPSDLKTVRNPKINLGYVALGPDLVLTCPR